MAHREKHDPTGRDVVGAEINEGESWDLIRDHALSQRITDPGPPPALEQIGAILVQLAVPNRNQQRWLVYSAMGSDPHPLGYKAKKNSRPNDIDAVEMITCVHHNPWSFNIGGVWYWIC